MRRIFVVLSGSICIILIIVFSIAFYFTHKTQYLNIESYQNSECMDIVGTIRLKDYPNTKTITDKVAIKKIVDYLNNIPLLSVYGYFDKSKREFIIPELVKDNEDSLTLDNERYGCLIFYDDKGIEKGRIILHNEKYIEGLNYHAYKVKNKEMLVISELESLDLR